MSKEILDKVNEKLKIQFPDLQMEAELLYDFPVFTVDHNKVHDVLKFLKEDTDLNFHFLTDLTAMQTADEKQLGVIYHLHNMPKNMRVRVKTFVDISKPEIPTATDLWVGANWMERESYDFYGVRFKGHPNLTRILNVDEMDIFPLRKEYPLEDQVREDKEDKLFGR
ncbi:NADH-quinone oxidoreductase subunit C [Aurantibacillus circumpalustris]|uniref:NADH-quinone oxidoreductase subunit C n=1 Tax=Aurantibacillus circumpalustris TaxID=3036359 RepID=UPI00295AC8C5|nr:NADH-quinone oxidoreductase subunit C [Aurantibacillus circumpalustris]